MKNLATISIVIVSFIVALVYGKTIIIPLILASLIWSLTRGLRVSLRKINFVKKYVPQFLEILIILCVMIFVLGTVSNLLSQNITQLTTSYVKYQPNAELILQKIEQLLQINISDSVNAALGNFEFGAFLGKIASGFSAILGNTLMIIIYTAFLFLEERSFQKKLEKMFDSEGTYTKAVEVLSRIENSVAEYLRLKTFVSALTGLASYAALSIIGVDSAFFWAFLIFLLNFIPTIGSLIATSFPALFSLLQFGELMPFVLVLVTVGLIQVIVGNFIEPKVMGKSLNLSPMVTILALAIWGELWGITGMILSVPITVIMVIVFSEFPRTKIVAVLLSEEGEV